MRDAHMIAIPVSDFATGPDLTVDIFIRLSEDRYLCVAKAGQKTQIMELTAFKKEKLTTLYIRKEDFQVYVEKTIALTEAALRLVKDDAKKTKLIRLASQSVFQELDKMGPSKEAVAHAKLVCEMTMSFVSSTPRLSALISSLQNGNDWVLNHSLATSAFCVMLGKELGWLQAAILEKLALGGLLHNTGMREIPVEVLNKPRAQYTQEELALYETHPYRGMILLQSVPYIPDDVVACVYEHHETASGQGFPRRLRDLRMNPLGKVVACAAQYAELLIINPNCAAPRTPEQAMQYIQDIMGQPFNKDVFKALQKLVSKDNKNQEAA
ncbi:MAG: HD-GYP domain-containing protein [Pseudobdellovibrionaceae bacterium]